VMAALSKFIDVRCEGSDRTHTFTLNSGELRLLELASQREKISMIDCAVGGTVCSKGSIEILQGDRRYHDAPVVGPFGNRRRNSGHMPTLWQPVSASTGRAGWVAANGGLISNLRVWENVTLPLWYHGRRDVVATEQSVVHWLGLLGLEKNEFADFMVAQPHAIEPWQRKLAGLLRALLQKSVVLVVDAALFEDVRSRLVNCWIMALETYAAEGRSVLAISDKATNLGWQKIE
jgi:hypothetical protein